MNKKTLILYSITLFLLAGALGVGGYFYYKYQELSKSPAVQSQKDFEATLADVGKLMQLPEDEQPSVATITDVEKLREAEPFFEKAENGDKLIAYSKALKAILYRPATNKIIDVVPLVINQEQNLEGLGDGDQGETTQGPEVTEKKTVAIYNGTANPGLGQQAKEAIESALGEELEVKTVSNATNQTYTNTIVVDLSQQNSEQALKLAEALSGSPGELPQDEITPQTDLLVILGSSWTSAPTSNTNNNL